MNETSDVRKCMVNKTRSLDACADRPYTENWGFNCSVKCPDINESLPIFNNVTMDIENICANSGLENISTAFYSMYTTTPLYSIPFESRCIDDVIDSMCDRHLPVPNIVHYVWFSKREMNFYHFLSFISVLKHQKPCLILVHSDVLPYGIYWNYLLRLAKNIVHVIMSPPNEIHGREIGRVEHQADVARLIVLQGNQQF